MRAAPVDWQKEAESLREGLEILRRVLVKYAEGFEHDAKECRGLLADLDVALGVRLTATGEAAQLRKSEPELFEEER